MQNNVINVVCIHDNAKKGVSQRPEEYEVGGKKLYRFFQALLINNRLLYL